MYDWLDSKVEWNKGRGLPVFAEAYKGALYLLNTRSPGYITFVATTGRDFMNILAPICAGERGRRTEYRQYVDKIQKKWRSEWDEQSSVAHDNHRTGRVIPEDTFHDLNDLIRDHNVSTATSNKPGHLFFEIFLGYRDHRAIPSNHWQEWLDAVECFRAYDHLRGGCFSEGVSSEVERHFQHLDGLLYVAASSEFERLRRLDGILEETNG